MVDFIDNINNNRLLFCSFPENITAKELIKVFCNKMYIPYEKRNPFNFQIGNSFLNKEDDINPIIDCNKIYVQKLSVFPCPFYGKLLKVSLKIKNEKGKTIISNGYAGTLEQIKHFYNNLNKLINSSYEILESPLIYPEKISINLNDERTFSDIGIRKDFTCNLKIKKNNFIDFIL